MVAGVAAPTALVEINLSCGDVFHRIQPFPDPAHASIFTVHIATLESEELEKGKIHTSELGSIYRIQIEGQSLILKMFDAEEGGMILFRADVEMYEEWAFKNAMIEARNYMDLQQLQGGVIPKFYGIFQSDDDIRAILLEDCGDSIGPPHELTFFARMHVLQRMLDLHDAHYQHGHPDFDVRHFLRRQAGNCQLAIIDLSRAREKHVCTRPKITPGEFILYSSTFGCMELWSMVINLDIWQSPMVRVVNESFCIREHSINCVDDILDLVAVSYGDPEYISRDDVVARAKREWEKIEELRREVDEYLKAVNGPQH